MKHSKLKLIILFFVLAPLLGVVLAGSKLYYDLKLVTYQGASKVFTITPGERFGQINQRLYDEGIISNRNIFFRYVKYRGLLNAFKVGQFEITPNSNITDIVQTLIFMPSITKSVTIAEGKNLYDIATILFNAQIIESKEAFIREAKKEKAEGYLYPETYKFSPKSPPSYIISSMRAHFNRATASLDFSKAPLNLTKEEVITLASIVEKETGANFERAKIAGIFLNRLKKKMRLQTDPTIIYGMLENGTYKGNIRRRDIEEKTAYNTYRIAGLPPGPISNPSLDAIMAVLNPEQHDFLYFVSYNDGTHHFSQTYKEHLRAVETYQKSRQKRIGKSWRDLNKNSKARTSQKN